MCKEMKDPPVAKGQWGLFWAEPYPPSSYFLCNSADKYFASFLKRPFFICLALGLTKHVSKLIEAQIYVCLLGTPFWWCCVNPLLIAT